MRGRRPGIGHGGWFITALTEARQHAADAWSRASARAWPEVEDDALVGPTGRDTKMNGCGTVKRCDGSCVVWTIRSKMDGQDCVAVRTGLIGPINKGHSI